MAQTVTAVVTCRSTARKFCRKVPTDTSAQVGRVAIRLAISRVATALNYSGHVPRPDVTGVPLPGLDVESPRKVRAYLAESVKFTVIQVSTSTGWLFK